LTIITSDTDAYRVFIPNERDDSGGEMLSEMRESAVLAEAIRL